MTSPDPNVPTEPNRPKDTRPRPQYGELAPEGWSWTPQDQAVEPVAPNEPTLPNVPVSVLGALPEAMQVLYTQENLGTYNPAASVAGLIIAGRVVEAAIWLAAAVVSILLLTRDRRAFYVPLVGGAVSI